MKHSPGAQKAWLVAAKRSLSKVHRNLTWDDFAKLAGIEPRALKSYRMPESSSDYRTMPALARQAIENQLAKVTGREIEDVPEPPEIPSHAASLTIPALAALVCRQAHSSLIEGRMISGVDKKHGMPIGLTAEDRRAMGLVSRACLTNQLPDHGAEIHDLLFHCTLPFSDWLDIEEVHTRGMSSVSFINAEEGVPTPEAEELASSFSGVTATVEEQLFSRFVEILGRQSDSSANEYYTRVREYVVRHPITSPEDLEKASMGLPGLIWIILRQDFYEAVPDSWEVEGGVPICAHCGNALKKRSTGLVCRTAACAAAHPAQSTLQVPAASILRVARGIRQYWVEPGLDEIRLYDALKASGIEAELYPHRDRVDISIGNIGIDLKTYTSPETLGMRFKRSLSGLAYYERKWVVVPDWQVISTPSYLDRLRAAANRPELEFLRLGDALSLAKHLKAAGHA